MADETMRTIRFHEYGEAADVLQLERALIPQPAPGTVLVRVHACGLNPADWALCRGLFPHELPRGIGLDVSGTVTALGEGVAGVAIGDAVFGPAEYAKQPTAGASDYAALSFWTRLPNGLSHVDAAALPMVVETARRYLDLFDIREGRTILINGAGTMVGFSAVQMALHLGARVIATAGDTFADRLREFGAIVTAHGEGMVERVRGLIDGPPDFILDVAPVNLSAEGSAPSALRDLVAVAGGDPKRIVTVADFAGAEKTGVRTGMEEIVSDGDIKMRWDALPEYGDLAAHGRFTIPVGRTFTLEEWRDALDTSLAGRARGKLVLLTGA